MPKRRLFAIWLYAFFLQAGYFKSDPRLAWVPIDLTILLAVFVTLFLIAELLKTKKMHVGIILPLLFFVTFLPGLLGVDWSSYTIMKVIRFYFQTLLVALGPFFFITSTDEVQQFIKATVFLGLLLTVDIIYQVIVFKGNVWRITAFGSSVIAIGRSVGLVVIYFALKFIIGDGSFRTILLLMVAAIAILVSGQRMAIAGPLLTLAIAVLVKPNFKFGGLRRALVLFLIVVLTISTTYIFLPQRAKYRIDRFFGSGVSGFTDTARSRLISKSLEASIEHPFGLGLGGVQNRLGINYPHNIVVEAFAEGGLVAGTLMCFVLAISVILALILVRKSTADAFLYLFAFLVFSLMYSMVAGDFNDNRMLFALTSICFSVRRELLTNPIGVSR